MASLDRLCPKKCPRNRINPKKIHWNYWRGLHWYYPGLWGWFVGGGTQGANWLIFTSWWSQTSYLTFLYCFFATTQELQHKGLMAKPDKSEVVPDDAAQKKVKPGEKVNPSRTGALWWTNVKQCNASDTVGGKLAIRKLRFFKNLTENVS